MPGDAAILGAARDGHRGAERAPGRGARRPVLPLPPRPAVEPGARACGWGGSASAASSRSSTACCAARPTRASTSRSGEPQRPPRRALLHHAGLGHTPPAGRAPRSWSASSRTRSTDRASTRAPAASPRATASCSRASASPSPAPRARCFARIFAGHTGVDPYTTAVSDTYQDLFGEGIFTGKGLYDVDAFTAALEGRVPDNALLSHDLFEGLHARTGAGDGRRGGRRLPLERPGARPPPAPLDARRLADPGLALPLRARRATGLRAQPAARSSRAGRSSTTCAAAWSRPPRSLLLPPRLDRAAGQPGRSGPPPRSRVPRLSPGGVRRSRPSAGRARYQPLLAFLRGTGGRRGATARRASCSSSPSSPTRPTPWCTPSPVTAGPARHHPAPAARVGDRRRQRGAKRRAENGTGPRSFLVAMVASPAIALAGADPRPRRGARTRSRRRRRCWSLWAVAPLIAYRLSQPIARTATSSSAPTIGPSCSAWLARRGSTSSAFMGPDDHFLPPDNVQEAPVAGRPSHLADQHRHGAPLHAGGARSRLHPDRRAGRTDRRHAHHHGGAGAARGPPVQLVRHGEPGAASAPATSPRWTAATSPARSWRSPRGSAAGPRAAVHAEPRMLQRLEGLAQRAAAFADGMSFRFLYDPQRSLLAIGYRTADAEGPGRLDPSHYDLLASEARLASFIGIAKGDLPEKHWFHLGRAATSVHGVPTLLSWSATLFEYLMPLLVMRSYPETLLDETCRMAVRRQRDYAAAARRAVGDVGVRLRPRRSPRQLPVQGLRRPGPGPEAGPGRRAGGRALRDRAGRADRPRRRGREPAAPRGGRARSASTATSTPSTTRPAARRSRGADAPGWPAPAARWCARTSPTTRA